MFDDFDVLGRHGLDRSVRTRSPIRPPRLDSEDRLVVRQMAGKRLVMEDVSPAGMEAEQGRPGSVRLDRDDQVGLDRIVMTRHSRGERFERRSIEERGEWYGLSEARLDGGHELDRQQ